MSECPSRARAIPSHPIPSYPGVSGTFFSVSIFSAIRLFSLIRDLTSYISPPGPPPPSSVPWLRPLQTHHLGAVLAHPPAHWRKKWGVYSTQRSQVHLGRVRWSHEQTLSPQRCVRRAGERAKERACVRACKPASARWARGIKDPARSLARWHARVLRFASWRATESPHMWRLLSAPVSADRLARV